MNSFVFPELLCELHAEDSKLKAVCIEGAEPYIKHEILRSLADRAKSEGLATERFYTPMNYDLLGAVYVKRRHLLLFDGEAHNLNKNIADFSFKIINANSVVIISDGILNPLRAQVEKHLENARKFESAAAKINLEVSKRAESCLSKAKALNFIMRFACKNSLTQTSKKGRNFRRRLSASGAWGVHSFYESIISQTNRVVCMRERTKALPKIIVGGMQQLLNEYGIDTVTFYCSLDGTPEHLLIPELSTAFFCDNCCHEYPFEADSVLNLQRFLKAEVPADIKSGMSRRLDICSELVDRAVLEYFQANMLSEKISDICFEATDESKLARLKDEAALLI